MCKGRRGGADVGAKKRSKGSGGGPRRGGFGGVEEVGVVAALAQLHQLRHIINFRRHINFFSAAEVQSTFQCSRGRGRVSGGGRQTARVYVYMYMYTHIHIYIYAYTCICIHIYIYTYTRIHVYVYMYTHIHIYIYAYCAAHIVCGTTPAHPRAPPSTAARGARRKQHAAGTEEAKNV